MTFYSNVANPMLEIFKCDKSKVFSVLFSFMQKYNIVIQKFRILFRRIIKLP